MRSCTSYWRFQGKFAIKNDNYRSVRSLRLTDETWKALGIASECFGLTRADYLEEIVRSGTLPSNTWESAKKQPCITRKTDNLAQQDTDTQLSAATVLPKGANLEILRDRVLLSLKLGKQAPLYKAALKVLNHFIAELTSPE